MDTWTAPTVDDFKSKFVRDFPYAPASDPNNLDFVTDLDITNAVACAGINFNEGIGGDFPTLTEMYLYLTAFYLVETLKTAAKGISSQAQFIVNSKSVGGVSMGMQIPERYAQDPFISQFTANSYGMRYLNLVLPFLVGGMVVSRGRTTFA